MQIWRRDLQKCGRQRQTFKQNCIAIDWILLSPLESISFQPGEQALVCKCGMVLDLAARYVSS